MAVCFGKNQRFGDFFPVGEQRSMECFFEGANHSTDLAWIYDILIQLGLCVEHILVRLLPAFCARQAVTPLDQLLQDGCTIFRHIGFNQVNVLANVNAVQNGLLSRIFADKIFIEVADGSLIRRSGQADDKRIKIGKHLTPYIVNRTMAFIYNDTVKELRRNFGIVDDLFWCFAFGGDIFRKGNLFCLFVQFFPF